MRNSINKRIGLDELEYLEKIAVDTKKEFRYTKDTGLWYWYNRGDEETRYEDYATRLDALRDAVSPYIEENEG
jgi:hypothetical protein